MVKYRAGTRRVNGEISRGNKDSTCGALSDSDNGKNTLTKNDVNHILG